jgi:lactate dehydrogenase-like 2-hydroxyacid dehydrogenase
MGQIGTRVESLSVGALGNTFLVAALVRARRVNLRVQYHMIHMHSRSPRHGAETMLVVLAGPFAELLHHFGVLCLHTPHVGHCRRDLFNLTVPPTP